MKMKNELVEYLKTSNGMTQKELDELSERNWIDWEKKNPNVIISKTIRKLVKLY
jgi:hypothetical protein|tara:strand:+ start:4406 stop:4567 length:162 start_codon:yes stop_codon:yes gene_type:complete